jgi:hypothetical protein
LREPLPTQEKKPIKFTTCAKGHSNEIDAHTAMARIFQRGYKKDWYLPGGLETKQRYWVLLAGGKRVSCDGFNVMEQRPFEDQELEDE